MSECDLPGWNVIVVIPARNEAERMASCLLSVGRAAARAGVPTTTVVVADACRDDTARIASNWLGADDVLVTTDGGCVGAARALGVAAALDQMDAPLSKVWIANTDADSRVADDWLTRQLSYASAGVHAVAGVVDIRPWDQRLYERFLATYERRSDGSHSHVHGTNVGMRADAYMAAGGWRALKTAEDHDLWERLRAEGFRLVSDDGVRVVTSTRRVGRAPHGFAGNMNRMAQQLKPVAS